MLEIAHLSFKKSNISKGECRQAPEMAQLGRAQILVMGLILYCVLHSSSFGVLHINNKMQLFKLQKFFSTTDNV